MNKYISVGYPTSNVNISNCSRVRTSHPPLDNIIEVLYINNQQRKKLYQIILGSALYCRTSWCIKKNMTLLGYTYQNIQWWL